MHGPPPLTPRALRTRGALARLTSARADRRPAAPMRAMGLEFPGHVGLAAGFDRHGRLREKALALGFAAVELGTWTVGARRALLPSPVSRLVPCGVSLGRRPATPWSRAEEDYAAAMHAFHGEADYLTLNPGRDRPPPERFVGVAGEMARLRDGLALRRGRALPLVVKLPSAWLAGDDRVRVAARFVEAGADGLLVSAEGAASSAAACMVLAELSKALGRDVCMMSVGGIASVREALARVRAGAQLVQLHRAAGTRDSGLVARIDRAVAMA